MMKGGWVHVSPLEGSKVQLGEFVLHDQQSIALVDVLVRSRSRRAQRIGTVDVPRRGAHVERPVVLGVRVVLVRGCCDGGGVVDLGRNRRGVEDLGGEGGWNVCGTVVDWVRAVLRESGQCPSRGRTNRRAPVRVASKLRRRLQVMLGLWFVRRTTEM